MPNKNVCAYDRVSRWVTIETYVLAQHTVPRKALTTEHMRLSNKSVTEQSRANRRHGPCDTTALPKLGAVAVDVNRRLLKNLKILFEDPLAYAASPPTVPPSNLGLDSVGAQLDTRGCSA